MTELYTKSCGKRGLSLDNQPAWDNTFTVASSPSGIRIKTEFLPWDFSEPCFPKGFTALCALDGKEILQPCGEC